MPRAQKTAVRPAKATDSTCIGCGCTDSRACRGGCHWVRVNKKARKGVCSTCVGGATPVLSIVFEDHGQDFLEWFVDEEGIVLHSAPYQADVWAGNVVLNHDIKPGDVVWFIAPGESLDLKRFIRYPVAQVKRLLP